MTFVKCLISSLLLASLPLTAAVVYDETVNGDLSNNGLAPTAISLAAGSNQVFGSTGRGAAGIDRDYLTFTIPTGFALTALSVIPSTTVGGAVSFIGLEAGPQVTLSTSATTAAGLLGWWHYGPADGNILPDLAIASNGSSGFSAIGPGTYSIWIQDFNAGTFNYGFDFAVTATPEPSATAGLGLAILSFAALLRKKRYN